MYKIHGVGKKRALEMVKFWKKEGWQVVEIETSDNLYGYRNKRIEEGMIDCVQVWTSKDVHCGLWYLAFPTKDEKTACIEA